MKKLITTPNLTTEKIGLAGRSRETCESTNRQGAPANRNARAPRFFLKKRWTIFRGVVKYSSITEQLML